MLSLANDYLFVKLMVQYGVHAKKTTYMITILIPFLGQFAVPLSGC
jgi:hypothetical protein